MRCGGQRHSHPGHDTRAMTNGVGWCFVCFQDANVMVLFVLARRYPTLRTLLSFAVYNSGFFSQVAYAVCNSRACPPSPT